MLSEGLFDALGDGPRTLGPATMLLPRFGLSWEMPLMEGIDSITAAAPFRHMITPGGFRMSVAMTNCGRLGWVTDRSGYRYDESDPQTNHPWPAMPPPFSELAAKAAAAAGFPHFAPDACLINRYEPGAKMSLHQDRNEIDYSQPIVSVSLGIPAVFLFGGPERKDKPLRIRLMHGDIVVWGGPDRLRFHGVMPLKPAQHPRLGACRINLTFRKAG